MIVIVSPGVKPEVIALGVAPDKRVVPEIAAGPGPAGTPWLRTALPTMGWAGVPLGAKPSESSAFGFELVTEKLAGLSVWNVITPPSMVEGVEVPVIESIAVNRFPTVLVAGLMLKGGPVSELGAFENVIVLPLTVTVSPFAKPFLSEFAAAPDRAVAAVIGAGGTGGVAAGAPWLRASLPEAVPAGSKKSCPASTAEAATSEVLASVPIAVLRAALRFAAVAAGVVPMAKLPVGNGDALDAVN